MDDLIRQLSQRFGVSEETLRERAGPQLEQLAAHLPGGGKNVSELLNHPMFSGLESQLGGMFQGTPLAGLAGQFGLGGGVHESAPGSASEVEQAADREQDSGHDPATYYAREDGAAGPSVGETDAGGQAGTASGAFANAVDDPFDQDADTPGPQDTGDTDFAVGGAPDLGAGAPFLTGEGDAETAENVRTDPATLTPADGPNVGQPYDADAPGRDGQDAPTREGSDRRL